MCWLNSHLGTISIKEAKKLLLNEKPWNGSSEQNYGTKNYERVFMSVDLRRKTDLENIVGTVFEIRSINLSTFRTASFSLISSRHSPAKCKDQSNNDG